MKERPILFSAPMVRAILDGRKTQTRRLVSTREPLQFLGGRGEEADPNNWGWAFDGPDHNGYMVLGRGHYERHDHGRISIRCPHGEGSDRLWVRETFAAASREHHSVADYPADGRPRDADGYWAWYTATDDAEGPWRPSIFMPRWASRITLEITDVRVQLLQEISEGDARSEGCRGVHGVMGQMIPGPPLTAREDFERLWDRINGARRRRVEMMLGDPGYMPARPWRTAIDTSASWASNPWVWAITFRRVT